MDRWVGEEPGRMAAFLGSHDRDKLSEHPFHYIVTMGTICCAGQHTENNLHGAVLRFRIGRHKELTFYTVQPELLPHPIGPGSMSDVLHWITQQLAPHELHSVLTAIYACGMSDGQQSKMDEIREALGV